MNKIDLIKPDDWHVHFREGEMLEKLVEKPEKSTKTLFLLFEYSFK